MFGFRPPSHGLDQLLDRPRPSLWQQLWRQPCIYFARKLTTWRPSVPAQPLSDAVSVVCISDTHNSQPPLPDGDILIHAGDLTQSGSFEELQETLNWLRRQPHPAKIVVAGNHDRLLDSSRDQHAKDPTAAFKQRQMLDWGDIVYLENEEATVTAANGRRLRIYGSPLSPRHGNWAFQYPRAQDIWTGSVPTGIDILITHGPPRGHLDLGLGCVYLVQQLWRVRPRLHVFGHVHEGAGTEWIDFSGLQSAYERTVIGQGGIWNLVLTAIEFIKGYWRPAKEARCLLVNPAMVGGLRDNEKRKAVRILI